MGPLRDKEETMAFKIEEKRSFPRVKLRTPVNYQVRGAPDYNSVVSDDISLAGVSFINERYINPGALLELRISVLSKVLSPIGKIAWASPIPHSDRYKVGIEFLEFDHKDKNYLSDYIDTRRDMWEK